MCWAGAVTGMVKSIESCQPLPAMRGKKTSKVVRDKIKELLTARSSEEIPGVLEFHLEKVDPKERKVSSRTVSRIRAEAKKAGVPYRRTLEGVLQAKKRQEVAEESKRKLARALEALKAKTYKEAAAEGGISVSTLYRKCRAGGLRKKDQPPGGGQVAPVDGAEPQ